jgi:hypothetical protein
VWVVLLVLAAIAWAATGFQARSMGDMGGMRDMPPTPSPAKGRRKMANDKTTELVRAYRWTENDVYHGPRKR